MEEAIHLPISSSNDLPGRASESAQNGGGARRRSLADITNISRLSSAGDQAILKPPEQVKEDADLLKLVDERNMTIAALSAELRRCKLALQKVKQQNLELAQTNSQMLAELNKSKDQLKIAKHELACTVVVLGVKTAELEAKERMNKQLLEKLNHRTTSPVAAAAVVAAHPPVDDHRSTTKAKRKRQTGRQSDMNSNVTRQSFAQPGKHKKRSSSLLIPPDEQILEPKMSEKSGIEVEESQATRRRNSLRRRSSRFDVNLGQLEPNIDENKAPSGCSPAKKDDDVAEKSSTPLCPNTSINEHGDGTLPDDTGDSLLPLVSAEQMSVSRRSSIGRPQRRAAEKVVSYKEKPLNVKMRRE